MVCDPDYEIISIMMHIVFLHMRQLRLVQVYTENQYLLSMDIIQWLSQQQQMQL